MTDYGTLLRDHVSLEVRCVDRFAASHPIRPSPRSARLARRRQGHPGGREGERFGGRAFQEGREQRADGRPLINAAAAAGDDVKVVLIGVAQEKTPVCLQPLIRRNDRCAWGIPTPTQRAHRPFPVPDLFVHGLLSTNSVPSPTATNLILETDVKAF